jgi:twitching motility protein PilT
VLATEIMTQNMAIQRCIRDRRMTMLPSLIQIGGKDGMHTIDDSCLHLLTHGFISIDHALAHCRDQDFIKTNYDAILRERAQNAEPKKRR